MNRPDVHIARGSAETAHRDPDVRTRSPASRRESNEFDVEHAVHELVARHPVVGLAVGVVRHGALEFFHCHGVADLGTGEPITEHTVFRIASITKTFTAVAVMQLAEQGLVNLDAPANDYLKAYRLVPADPRWRPATVRHLLTHTAGLPEVAHRQGFLKPDFGESVMAGEPIPTLADFYGGHLAVYAEPGTRFVYNNHGPATLGQLVADVSGLPLDRYFREHIFEPLGMNGSDLLRSQQIEAQLATGYELHSRGVEQVAERDMVTAGAASIFSTPHDMARYLSALLEGGCNEHGSILARDTVATMFSPHHQPDPRIPGMGLGFFRKELSGHLVVRHQGTHPGFHSEMSLAPDDGVGVMTFTNGAVRPDFWLPAEASKLLAGLLGSPDDSRHRAVPHQPAIWEDICGRYRLDARMSDVRLRGMMGLGAEVFVRGGRPMLRFLSPIPTLALGLRLEPDDATDPYAFRVELPDEGLEPIRIVFGQDAAGNSDRLHLDIMPLTLRKEAGIDNPRSWAAAALGLAGGAFALKKAATRASS